MSEFSSLSINSLDRDSRAAHSMSTFHIQMYNVAAELSFPSVMQCFSDNQWHGSGFTGVAHPPMQPCGSALGLRDMASPTLRFITWKEVIQVPVIEVENIRSDQIVMELIISAFILRLPLSWIYLFILMWWLMGNKEDVSVINCNTNLVDILISFSANNQKTWYFLCKPVV